MTDPIEFDVEDKIAYLTLNRPDVGNAIDLPLASAFLKAVIRCDQDKGIRCVVIRGSGRLFCAGGDLQAFKAAGDNVSSFLSELAGTLHLAISRLMRMQKPVVVLVNGAAAGAGYGLAMVGDIVLAAKSASFTPGYGAIGLNPDGGLTWHLPRLVGVRRAQQILFLNKSLSAEEAAKEGLVTDALADQVLQEEGPRIARELATSATLAIGRTRQLLLGTYENGLEAHLEREARAVAEGGGGTELREGLAAFREKRRPDFQ